MRKLQSHHVLLAVLLGLASSVILGCNRKPPHVIDENEMVSLLADMQIAEAYASANINGSKRSEERNILGKQVLESHHVTQEDVDSTLAWYGRNLDDYSRLFENVDKEINRRREEIASADPGLKTEETTEYWRLPPHAIITDMADKRGWIFSYDDLSIEKGEKIIWSFFLPENTDFKGTLGVIYDDGGIEVNSNSFGGTHHLEMKLQTDTAKRVVRLFGSMLASEKASFPVVVDSIRLYGLPYDSLEYGNKRGQKHFNSFF